MATVLDHWRVGYPSIENEQEQALPNDASLLTDNDIRKIQSATKDNSGWKSTTAITLGALGIYTAALFGAATWFIDSQKDRLTVYDDKLALYEKAQNDRLASYEAAQSQWLSAYQTSMKSLLDDVVHRGTSTDKKIDDVKQDIGLLGTRIDNMGQTFLQSVNHIPHDHQESDDLDAAKTPQSVNDLR